MSTCIYTSLKNCWNEFWITTIIYNSFVRDILEDFLFYTIYMYIVWLFDYLQLDADAGNVLKELQQQLNSVLDELSTIFAKSLEPQIQQSMQELGTLLSKVKGAGQVSLSQPSQRSNIQQESDMVLRPLMDLLDGRLVQVEPLFWFFTGITKWHVTPNVYCILLRSWVIKLE